MTKSSLLSSTTQAERCFRSTISALNFVYDGTGNSDGRPSGLNSRGQIAFWARFNDGTQGIFVSDRVAVPEPSTLGLIVVGIASLLVRRLF